jgi:NTP pyrophosphatase (non-canonical NTP hydrolase)
LGEIEMPFKAALEKYGHDAQLDMVIEECSELILAIQRYRRKRCEAIDIQEEIADVEIMLSQMRILFGDQSIDEFKAYKIMRLKERINRS